MMHNGFWFGTSLHDFLFPDFDITTWPGMVALCVGTSVLAFFYEALKVFRVKLSEETCEKVRTVVGESQVIEVWTHSWKVHLVHTLLNLLQISCGYALMLVVMSYNAYIAMSVLLGACIGFFILSPLLVQPESRPNSSCDVDERGVLIQQQQHIQTTESRNPEQRSISVTADVHSLYA